MSDEPTASPAGCLGRLLGWVGSAWLALVILAGVGAFRSSPLDEIASVIGANLLPALALIAAGAALSRRGRMAEKAPQAPAPSPPPPTPRRLPPLPPRKPASPLPASPIPDMAGSEIPGPFGAPDDLDEGGFDPVTHPMFDFDFGPGAGGKPKTSKEMIEEAKRRLRDQGPPT